jgi:peptidyl-prolyl cis-trans isomerase-like protein 2
MDVASENTIREASPEEILQAQFDIMKQQKQKGYVRLITNLGDLLLELHCDIVPRTCTNFLGLVQAKKYDGTTFHRLIPNFMIQGGKAKSGGEDASLWGPSFVDEFDDRLKHVAGGVVSMANSGPGTNKRQFFITFKSCPQLDRKHSIFGEVVDDNGVLKKMENRQADKKDRPLEPIKIIKAEILVDPAKDAMEMQQKQMEEREKERQEEETRKKAMALGKSGVAKTKKSSSTSNDNNNRMIGKYLPKSVVQSKVVDDDDDDDGGVSNIRTLPVVKPKAPPPTKTKFGNFSGW